MDAKIRELLKQVVEKAPDKFPIVRQSMHMAQIALEMDMQGKELAIQIRHLLGGLGQWRGKESREIRQQLKKYMKENRK